PVLFPPDAFDLVLPSFPTRRSSELEAWFSPRDAWTRNVFSVRRGTGSGFIWDDAGHVVTNFHVIQGATEATVKLADGRDYQAALDRESTRLNSSHVQISYAVYCLQS